MNGRVTDGPFNAWDDFKVSAVSCAWVTVRCLHHALNAIATERDLNGAEKAQLACYADIDDTLFDLMANTHLGLVWGDKGLLEKLEALFQNADRCSRAGVPARELLRNGKAEQAHER